MKNHRAGTKRVDIALLISVLALILFGMVMLYSTSSYNGLVKFGDAIYYLKKQFFATSLGPMGVKVSMISSKVLEKAKLDMFRDVFTEHKK